MNRQASLSRISSRSLSKIKTKIELAFTRPVNNQNKAKNEGKSIPVRSKSTKSLSKYREEQPISNNIPFAVAIKTGLISSKKNSVYQTPAKESRIREDAILMKKKGEIEMNKATILCERVVRNEVIAGFSWYSSSGKQLISVCKKSEDKLLRYFAVREEKEGKLVKKVVAALEDTLLFSGGKQYMLIGSNKKGLIDKAESSKVDVTESDFVVVIDQKLMAFCNINRLISDIYSMVKDGLSDMDTIVKVLGRRIGELALKSVYPYFVDGKYLWPGTKSTSQSRDNCEKKLIFFEIKQ